MELNFYCASVQLALAICDQETEIDFTFDDGVTPGFRIGENGKKIITVLHITGDESRSGAVEEVELTKESFDSLFRDNANGWTGKTLNAAKLRRATANAWHGTLLGETNWPREMYLLQQKDGTLYLAMGYDKETIERFSGRVPFFRWVFRLSEKTTPVHATMEDYALAQIEAIRENGISYYVRGKDDFLEEFFDTVEDVRVMELYRLGELSDFAPDGTLELWRFSAEAKPSNRAGNEIMLVGGQNLSDDGYFSDGYSTYLVMMHKDDGYHTLRSFISNDGGEVGRYPTVGAYLHDAYCDVSGFPGPYNLLDSLFRYTDGYGREVSDDGILTRGDGWYFYLPSGAAWVRNGGIHDLWYSAYSTESTITVNAFDTTVEETAASLISDGWTKETSGALTVYRHCCPSLPQSLIPSFDAYESVYLYERPEGGHYEVLTVWYDLADEVNEWGWSPKAQVAAERTQLETMVQSFTVVPASKTDAAVVLSQQYIKHAFSHGNTSTPEFFHDIGKPLSALKSAHPEGECVVCLDGFPDSAAACFGEVGAEYLYYFFGTQSGDAEKAMNECEDRLKCAGFVTTASVLFPDMEADLPFEDFFSLIGVDGYEYFSGEDVITAQGWLRFTYHGMEVMVNTNEATTGGGWKFTGDKIVKRTAPVSIVDLGILNTNQDLAEPVMFD